jgi:hypothetical protein
MNINKAHWSTEGDNLRLSMPFAKVDEERRIVSGFATLDNLDKQNDIVTQEASVAAFEKFKGNIREMHQPLAVGKLVSFKQDRFFDPATKKFYNGVFVSAYVSKGAQDTWEKVLDGTLSSFSIGGNIHKWDDAIDEESKKSIRIIKDYDLFELSLVDSPANQLANILSVQKTEDGQTTVTGSASEVVLENVFWDSENGIVSLSENESETSPISGSQMKNIGFVEKSDNEKAEMIKFLVDSAKGIKTIKMTKEVNPMTEDKNVEVVAEETTPVVEEAPVVTEESNVEIAPEAPTEAPADAAQEAVVEESVNPEEVAPAVEAAETEKSVSVDNNEEAIVKAVSDIKDSLNNAFGDLAATVKSISDTVAELSKSLANVTDKVAEVTKEVSDVKGGVNEFGKRVDAVEADTAFRKSGDLGEIVQEFPEMRTHKSLWGGRFLKNTDLFN